MTNSELFQIIRPIILLVTGIPKCILTNPNEDAPSGDYCAVQPKQTISEQTQAVIYHSNGTAANTVNWEVRAQMVAQCSVNFYRGDALSYAELLAQADKRPDVAEMLQTAVPQSIGWQRVSVVNNLTALQSDQWEPRANISIYLMYEIIPASPSVVNSIEKAFYEITDVDGNDLASGEVQTDDAP